MPKVNHYMGPHSIELIDVVGHLNFNRGNIVKYIVRAGKKGRSKQELADLKKARDYIDFEIKRLQGFKMSLEEIDVEIQMSVREHTEQEDLSFRDLRKANIERQREWGTQNDLLFYAVGLGGEVGELLNVVKKLLREEKYNTESLEDLKEALKLEIADVLIYLDILAEIAGVSLEEVTKIKFNATSKKHDLKTRL